MPSAFLEFFVIALFGVAQLGAGPASETASEVHARRWAEIFAAPTPAERVEALQVLLAATEDLSDAEQQAVAASGQAAYTVAELAHALHARGDSVEALQVLQLGRDLWTESSAPSWEASMVVEEARILDELGLRDRAEALHSRAVRLVEDVLENEERPNVGAYVEANLEAVRHRLRSMDYAGGLQTLDRFEEGADWEEVERRIDRARFLADKGAMLFIRCAAGVHVAERNAEARTGIETLIGLEGAHPADRLGAYALLIYLEVVAGRPDAVQRARAGMEELWASLGEFELQIARELMLGVACVRASLPDERGQALEALAEMNTRARNYRRENSLLGGTALTRYSEFRAAAELLLLELEGPSLVRFLVAQQTAGQLWESLGRPTPIVPRVLQAVTGAGTGCLIYVRGVRSDYWISLGPRGQVARFPVPILASWYEKARDYGEELATDPAGLTPGMSARRTRNLASLGEELAGLLFPAALREQVSTWRRLNLVGRDDLGGLVLEALPLEAGPLGCTHAIVDVPSLPVSVALRDQIAEWGGRRGAQAQTRWVKLVADPAASAQVRARGLPGNWELTEEGLFQSLGWKTSQSHEVRLGGEATASALQYSGEALLQVVAHGVRDPYSELGTLLALAPNGERSDGMVGGAAVRSMQSAPTVILSVCFAGDAPARSGDAGSNHLGGAFLEAGATAVVLAPASVRLDGTLELSRRFYAEWLEGTDAPEALRRARAGLAREAANRFADPYHWASMRVFGIGPEVKRTETR